MYSVFNSGFFADSFSAGPLQSTISIAFQVLSFVYLHFQRPGGFGGSNHLLLDGFTKLRTGKDILGSFNFVDVRCAAESHVEALIRPSAGGNRILLPGHCVSWQEICELLEFGDTIY